MQHIENTFMGIKNTKLFYEMWLPDKPKAILQIVHGFGEHSIYYDTIANEVVPKGIIVVANDHRGHGKSEGEIMYADSFDDFVADAKILTDLMKKEYPKLPIFLFGQSMGSVIALKYTEKYEAELKGLILAASGTKVGGDVSKFLIFMAKLLSKLTPHMKVPSGGTIQFSTHDQEFIERFKKDPLNHTEKASARLGYCLISGFGQNPGIAAKLKLPLLFIRGGDDTLVIEPQPLIDAFQMADKTFKIYPGRYHAVFTETEELRKEPMADLSQWLLHHV